MSSRTIMAVAVAAVGALGVRTVVAHREFIRTHESGACSTRLRDGGVATVELDGADAGTCFDWSVKIHEKPQ